jgi:hypothetical protein
MGFIIWFQTHWQEIVQIYLAVVGAASLIVKLTPTLKDDTILLNIIRFIAKYLALNVNAPTERPS